MTRPGVVRLRADGGAGADASSEGGERSEPGSGGQGGRVVQGDASSEASGGGTSDESGFGGQAAGAGGRTSSPAAGAGGRTSSPAAGAAGDENAGAAGEGNAHPCDPNPCMNGGTCADKNGVASCTCEKAFTGTRCELPSFELVMQAALLGISADGATVVGYSAVPVNNTYLHRAVVKNGSAEPQVLGLLPGSTECEATATNADGSVVVGYCTVSGGSRAFLRKTGGQLQDLGLFEKDGSARANAISGDGLVVVGEASINGITKAFRWTADEGMQDIGSPTANSTCSGAGTNRDGSLVTGYCQPKDGEPRALIWTAKSGAQRFVDLLPSCTQSWGTAVTPDGTTVVGACHGPVPMLGGYDWPHKSFLWKASGQLDDLNAQSNSTGNKADWPKAICADGSTVIGTWGADEGVDAFAWDSTHGQIALMDYLTAKGLDTDSIKALDPTKHWFEDGTGISADGKVIVGYFHGGGFIARLP